MRGRHVAVPRTVLVLVALFPFVFTACGSSSGTATHGSRAGAAQNIPAPPRTVIARPLRGRAHGELRPGTRVGSGFHGVRVFAGARVGFAITDVARAGGGTYPVATADGGRTWRTDGPVLHAPAAQGPVAVDQAGVAGPKMYFAWCGACNMVIDITPDAGTDWWRTFMPGEVLSVLTNSNGHVGLTAIVAGPSSARNGRGASLWVYQSSNGRRWTYSYTINATS